MFHGFLYGLSCFSSCGTAQVIVDSSFPGVMPREEALSSSTWELVQMMALLEAWKSCS